MGPGVYAVANADAPVFYADNYYWLYTDGLWYRSSYATGGWSYAPAPYVIRQIDRPLAYQRPRTYRRDRQVHVEVIEPAHRVHRDRPQVYQGERRRVAPVERPGARTVIRGSEPTPPPPPPGGRVDDRNRAPAPERRTQVRDREVPAPAPAPARRPPARGREAPEREHRTQPRDRE
jgi:hypothetical protein